ncbi:putative Serine protein kinase [Aspergillus mulundensis]|uniref:non-specific serine/threonine protein kinase n=1 Tax=Aspergillus mulundensis TaxID=1810919 RepID=A0A3D8QI90_9EURO|nr:putative Serine protein kinase [Aspergillus mulundensis]RDW61134.1 putative Serine protein kinase [Aspergillus mulundensis]
MNRLTHRLKQSIFGRPPCPIRRFSTPGPSTDPTNKLEEEKLAGYSPAHFYPVKIGEVFRSRYQVLGKLGYGGHSTVWLCRDLQQHVYVTLKMCEHGSSHGRREQEVYKHLRDIKTSHVGSMLVRRAIDDFQLRSTDGTHSYQCFVHPPLAMSVCELRHRTSEKLLPEDLLKPTLIHLLLALDFLHTEAKVVHTDIQGNNILLSVEDESILVDFEEAERSSASPCKITKDRVIYASRDLGIPKVHGRPILSDFGEARFISGLGDRWEDVQPLVYRAPEVILRIPWNEKIDIWNVGVLAWNLFEREPLFYARDPNGHVSDSHHLAGMTAVMGTPPKQFLRKSEYARKFFDDEGNWTGIAEVPSRHLEKLEGNLRDSSQTLFLGFMRKMLQWEPENRASAKELLADPWLKST